MFKCLYLISFKHGFLQTYSSRRIFWYKQFYVFSITSKTSTVPLGDVVVSHDLVGRFFLSFFDLLWLPGFGSTKGFVPSGSRIGDLSLPDDPCPPDLGGLGQKVEIFDGPPLPAPFGTKVPSCPLARGPGAVLFVGRGLVGSSSELTSWMALLMLIVSISISFSSSFEAADCRADSVLWIVVSFFCSGVVCGGGGVSSEEGAFRGTGFS